MQAGVIACWQGARLLVNIILTCISFVCRVFECFQIGMKFESLCHLLPYHTIVFQDASPLECQYLLILTMIKTMHAFFLCTLMGLPGQILGRFCVTYSICAHLILRDWRILPYLSSFPCSFFFPHRKKKNSKATPFCWYEWTNLVFH